MTVIEVQGDSITVAAGKDAALTAGDLLRVGYTTPDGDYVEVGTWRVSQVTEREVRADKVEAFGKPTIGISAELVKRRDEAPPTSSIEPGPTVDGVGTPQQRAAVYVEPDAERSWTREELGAQTWYDAEIRCRALEHGGRTDWLMPTIDQLRALNAAVDRGDAVIPLGGCCVWSSELEKDGDRHIGLAFDFERDRVVRRDIEKTIPAEDHPELRALCVRTPWHRADEVVEAGEGMVLDSTNNLTWTRVAGAGGRVVTWDEAHALCSGLSLGGKQDWRLPTRQELRLLMDERHSRPLNSCQTLGGVIIDPDHGGACRVWSSEHRGEDQAWLYDFRVGGDLYADRDNRELNEMKRKRDSFVAEWEGPRVLCIR